MIYFTSDFHLGHTNIIKYCDRPFACVEDMDDTILDRLNSVVKRLDVLYFLGDFCFTRGNHHLIKEYRKRINCKNVHMIRGNHDYLLDKFASLFSSINPILDCSVYGQNITLCHYAMKVWNKSHYGAWHLYGHSHGTLLEDSNSLSMDVGVDNNNFFPYSFDSIKLIMSHRGPKPIERELYENS